MCRKENRHIVFQTRTATDDVACVKTTPSERTVRPTAYGPKRSLPRQCVASAVNEHATAAKPFV